MITQPNPHLEARPTTPLAQRELHMPLSRRPAHTPNLALAGLQLLVGYAWLLAGVDKLLLGAFPVQLGGLLRTGAQRDVQDVPPLEVARRGRTEVGDRCLGVARDGVAWPDGCE